MARGFIKKMITMIENMISVIKKMITVIRKYDYSDDHRNQEVSLLTQNHRNQFIKKTRGQSIAEYSILIAAVTAALLAMQLYMKRGIQAAIKHSADQFGNQEDSMETDPEEVTQQDVFMETTTEATTRIQQEGKESDESANATLTTDELTTSTGVSVYWKEEEWEQ